MPARENFQVTIKLPGDKSVTLPSQPITLPADAYFVWPFNLDLSGLHLRYATAQPLAILGTTAAPVYAFFAQPGIPPEFVIDDTPGLKARPNIHRPAGYSRGRSNPSRPFRRWTCRNRPFRFARWQDCHPHRPRRKEYRRRMEDPLRRRHTFTCTPSSKLSLTAT